VSSIGIYLEGGGPPRSSGRAALRQGMERFLAALKQRARDASWHWKLACWGGRNETFERFIRAVRDGEHSVTVLLVDAEGPVAQPVLEHLRSRDPCWNLGLVQEEMVHLMVQTMETWIAADASALAGYYGEGFQCAELPKRQDLELESRYNVTKALRRASRDTGKGRFHKIQHAGDLLKLLDHQTVRSRCPSCERLFTTLDRSVP